MIFVTVGLHKQGFNRLIKKMDEIGGILNEEVIIQIGHSSYEPRNVKYFRFLEDFSKIHELNNKARLIITHGGAGSILTALKLKKPVIAVPRLKKFNEHIDDHQLELVEALERIGKIIVVYDVDDLETAIARMDHFEANQFQDINLVKNLSEYIEGKIH